MAEYSRNLLLDRHKPYSVAPLPPSPLSTLSLSYDSIIPSEEDESDRNLESTVRRGSRLSDIIHVKQRRRRHHDKKRQGDKNGFIWRRLAQDGDLLHQRAPLPHLSRPPSVDNSQTEEDETRSTALQEMSSEEKTLSETPDSLHTPNIEDDHDRSSPSSMSPTPPSTIVDPDTASNKSDNSFRTASSDPQVNLLPPTITDTYNTVSRSPLKKIHGNENGSPAGKELFLNSDFTFCDSTISTSSTVSHIFLPSFAGAVVACKYSLE